MSDLWRVDCADCLDWFVQLPADSADLVLGSPPYEAARCISWQATHRRRRLQRLNLRRQRVAVAGAGPQYLLASTLPPGTFILPAAHDFLPAGLRTSPRRSVGFSMRGCGRRRRPVPRQARWQATTPHNPWPNCRKRRFQRGNAAASSSKSRVRSVCRSLSRLLLVRSLVAQFAVFRLDCTYCRDSIKDFEEKRTRQTTSRKVVSEGSPP